MSGDDQKSHFHFFHFYFPFTFSTFSITFWFVKVLPALFIILGPDKSSYPPQCPCCHSFANWWRQELALFTFSFLISFFIFFLWSLSFYYSNFSSWICIPASMSPFIWQSRLVMKIKASEMLVAPRISECFGLPWSALVCYSLPWSAIVCLGCCWFSCCWFG